MNNITIDLEDIINNIFNDIPKEQNSIHLSFDVKDEYELFNMLVNVLTSGMKILYGDEDNKVDINTITEDNFNNIQKYFRSFGFIVKYKYEIPLEKINIDNTSSLPKLDDSYIVIENEGGSQLKLYYFTLKSDNIKYEISFDYL
jgi:hypothetical protein